MSELYSEKLLETLGIRMSESTEGDRNSGIIRAPWSEDLIETLNFWQTCGYVHEYTCGKCRAILTPTRDGWICTCGYKQDWCCSFHVKGKPSNPLEKK